MGLSRYAGVTVRIPAPFPAPKMKLAVHQKPSVAFATSKYEGLSKLAAPHQSQTLHVFLLLHPRRYVEEALLAGSHKDPSPTTKKRHPSGFF